MKKLLPVVALVVGLAGPVLAETPCPNPVDATAPAYVHDECAVLELAAIREQLTTLEEIQREQVKAVHWLYLAVCVCGFFGIVTALRKRI